jgi:Na+/H+-dicarboxylate symporter
MILLDRLKQNLLPAFLMMGVVVGVTLGFAIGEKATILKPFGDLFLRFLFVAAVPLVFFSISSTFASFQNKETLGKILLGMVVLFILTGVISAFIMIVALHFFPLEFQSQLKEIVSPFVEHKQQSIIEQVVSNLTATDFYELLSRQKMLALILFAALFGLSVSALGDEAKVVSQFLDAGAKVMMKLVSYIMFYAPFGLGCYGAYMVGTLGAGLLKTYGQAVGLYYGVAVVYFFIGFTVYLFLIGEKSRVKEFWQAMILPSVTAFTLGSSIATIPVSLKASERLKISNKISEVVIPVGATIHMDGTCLSAVLKIAFAFR